MSYSVRNLEELLTHDITLRQAIPARRVRSNITNGFKSLPV
jgi:hypothetical protein